GLRSVPADSDRLYHRAARVRGGYEEDLRDLPAAARRADHRAEARRMAGGTAARIDVCMGAGAGTVSADWVVGVRETAAAGSAGGGVARDRIWTAGGGPRPFCADRERSAAASGDAVDWSVSEE